jgi:putrescine---pyruvate transaminase
MSEENGLESMRLREINNLRHLHPLADQRLMDYRTTSVMVRGKGVYLWDSEGRRYIDGMSGLFCTAVGYGRPELVAAAHRQMQELSYCSMFFNTTHPRVTELSERLFALLPPSFGRVIYANSGSEANETLIRCVRRFWQLMGKPGKQVLIGRRNGYHGSTVATASLGALQLMHEMDGLPIAGFHHIGEPYWFEYQGDLGEHEFGLQLARELEQKILELGAENVAAFVGEPIQGAGGLILPPSSYWPEIERICRKHDVLLCVDEVVGGFGRTGEWFSHQLYGIAPDAISIAKGLTSGYVPMGGLLLSRAIADVLVEGGVFAHGYTYQGHPLAAAVACANLDVLDQGGVVQTVRTDTGPYFQAALRAALDAHPLVWDIQGEGMAAAVQLGPEKGVKKRFEMQENIIGCCMWIAMHVGLIIRPTRGRLVITPPLVATRAEIDLLVARLKIVLDRTSVFVDKT